MTQSVVVQIGQCGNQIGCRFWELALREHASVNKNAVFEEALNSFFRHVDAKSGRELQLGDGKKKISSLKARAVLVDMEEGVVNQLLNGALQDVFDCKQFVTSHSGSGNNWAVGHKYYGSLYAEKLTEVVRRAAELCDSLQTFFVLHSMGGGTGSGLGTYILHLLEEEFPDVYRFVVTVCPSADDDVITSPYNSILAMRELSLHADCVLPVENQSLIDICSQVNRASDTKKDLRRSSADFRTTLHNAKTKPFDQMNAIIANLLLNLTSSSRFPGSLNVDLNEITTNLVPFPQLHYLIPSMAPLYSLLDVNIPPRRLDQMFSTAFSKECHLIKADPRLGMYLACAVLVRGNVNLADVQRNITKLQSKVQFMPWNSEGWKIGLCDVPPTGHQHSLLTLGNNTCITSSFEDLECRFQRLYKRKAHLHHYLQVDGMELEDFDLSAEAVRNIITEYQELEKCNFYVPPKLEAAV